MRRQQQIVGNTVVLHDPSGIVASSPCAIIELVRDVREYGEQAVDEEPYSAQGLQNGSALNDTEHG